MKSIFLVLIFSLAIFQINAQDFNGFNQSNYAGVTGVIQQPASIVDSRMKFDMTLIGLNVGAYNNYIGIHRTAFKRTNGKYEAFNDTTFAAKYVTERTSPLAKVYI